ncbi:1-phosphofructokinase family hexose kinase [Cryptosporangium aurantiacum]|uniref:1-phosphofructokinase family hexose kinase n=1 Tax=Cryptosporangium aurantiacum TaxID=134849 RepID=UPI00116117F3|nr:PfkB family carbohydrate kinase [Cryptosporangium aurantiacum]
MLIANPNLALDRLVTVAEIVPGAVMRSRRTELSPGGKGVNVARVLRAHGVRVPLLGLLCADDGALLAGLLADEGADLVAVPTPGRVRQALVFREVAAGRTTVVNEPGDPVPAGAWLSYLDAAAARLAPGDLFLAAGSLPAGVTADGYRQLVELAHRAGALIVMDAAPAALAAALPARPDLVTPNLEEAEAALSGAPADVLPVPDGVDVRARAEAAARALVDAGARRAVVTAGAAGAAFATSGSTSGGTSGCASGSTSGGTAEATDWVPSVPVTVVSAVGAGDSFVGGLALELRSRPRETRDAWRAAVVRGVATAAASCETPLAGGVVPARARELRGKIESLSAEVGVR